MSKKINKVGYIVEIVKDTDWKVVVKLGDVERYFYIFDTEEQAIEKFNSIN
jgi:hypothetical protein